MAYGNNDDWAKTLRRHFANPPDNYSASLPPNPDYAKAGTMNSDQIVRIARTLYGKAGWAVNLAAALGTTDRHVRYWLAGDEAAPGDLDRRLRQLAAQRLAELTQLCERLDRDAS